MNEPGIVGHLAPALRVDTWRDAGGNPTVSVSLTDLPGRYKLLYFFQSWCPGCHSGGFPTLKRILGVTTREELGGAAIQTVFEGHEANTEEKAFALQADSKLGIPFGHDTGASTRSYTMQDYRSGGTPWFVLIDPSGTVVANEFHLDADSVIAYVKREAPTG